MAKAKKVKMPAASTYKEWLPTVGDKTRFVLIGKGKKVHVVNTKAIDLKAEDKGGNRCRAVRQAWEDGKIKPANRDKGISADAALALDGCSSCRTEVVARSMVPKDTKEDRRARRDEVLDRTKPERKPKPGRKDKASKGDGSHMTHLKSKQQQPTKTKAGTRSVGDSSQAKAEDLAAFIREQGWKTKVSLSEPNGATVEAKQGDKVIECNFIDGKYDVTRQATITVGSWTATLRGAHAVRRQVDSSLDDRDRPHPKPGVGRSGPRKAREDAPPEDESPEDARKRVPFLLDDDDATVLDAVMGKVIRWRNGQSNVIEEAHVPPEVGKGKRPWVSLSTHPKSNRRILDFFVFEGMSENGPVFGPERAVALEKILRVLDA